ncbi:MAG: HPF/RaiA family ribosome-associated protein [Oligoflexus sp.]
MQIQVRSNNSVNMTEEMIRWASDEVKTSLDRFMQKMTRIEVHFNDENGEKEGNADKYCSIEARLKGMQPLAASHKASSFHLALNGALEKLETVLGRTIDKMENKKGRTPFGGEHFAGVDEEETSEDIDEDSDLSKP